MGRKKRKTICKTHLRARSPTFGYQILIPPKSDLIFLLAQKKSDFVYKTTCCSLLFVHTKNPKNSHNSSLQVHFYNLVQFCTSRQHTTYRNYQFSRNKKIFKNFNKLYCFQIICSLRNSEKSIKTFSKRGSRPR